MKKVLLQPYSFAGGRNGGNNSLEGNDCTTCPGRKKFWRGEHLQYKTYLKLLKYDDFSKGSSTVIIIII